MKVYHVRGLVLCRQEGGKSYWWNEVFFVWCISRVNELDGSEYGSVEDALMMAAEAVMLGIL